MQWRGRKEASRRNPQRVKRISVSIKEHVENGSIKGELMLFWNKCNFTSTMIFTNWTWHLMKWFKPHFQKYLQLKQLTSSCGGLSLWSGIMRADTGYGEHTGRTDLPPNWNFTICVGHKCQFHPAGKQQEQYCFNVSWEEQLQSG